jgi:hypothetical protein
MMKKLESDPELHKSMAEQLRKDFEENLNQSHDFLQLVKLVRGHAEVLLNAKYPELDSADAAERLPTEGAIFFSTELMLVKMDSLIYLNEINRALGGESRVLVHPLVLKYGASITGRPSRKNSRSGSTVSAMPRARTTVRPSEQSFRGFSTISLSTRQLAPRE